VVYLVKLMKPKEPGPNDGLQDEIVLDIWTAYFPLWNETDLTELTVEIKSTLGMPPTTQVVIIDASVQGDKYRLKIGFLDAQCGAWDYGYPWAHILEDAYDSPNHGPFSGGTHVAQAQQSSFAFKQHISVCTVGGEINWGATCISLQDSSISSSGGGLSYEEAVGIVVAIAILILLALLIGDFLHRKAHRHENQGGGTEMSTNPSREKPKAENSPIVEEEIKTLNSPTSESRPPADSEPVDVA